MVKNHTFGQKSNFWSKIKILVKTQIFGQKIKFLFTNQIFVQKSNFCSKIKSLFENPNIGQKFQNRHKICFEMLFKNIIQFRKLIRLFSTIDFSFLYLFKKTINSKILSSFD